MEQGRISGRQLMLLSIILIFSTGVMFLPAIAGKEARQDTWVSGLLIVAFGALVGLLHGTLARRFPRENPSEYGMRLLGPVFGRVAALVLVWFAVQAAALVAREFGELMVASLMPETPLSVFIIIQVWLVCSAVRNGIEVIARVNEFWLPILLGATFLIVALVAKDADWSMLRPVMAEGWAPVLRGSYAPAAWMGETVILLYAMACLNQPKESTPALLKGMVAAGLLLTLGAVVNIAVFGPEQVGRQVFPTLNLSRLVDVARFITRIESLTVILWLVGTLVKMALFLHAAAVGLARTVGLAEYVPLVLPLGALTVSLAVGMFPNMPSLVAFLSGPWPAWALWVELGIPLLLLAAGWIRGGGMQAPTQGSARQQSQGKGETL